MDNNQKDHPTKLTTLFVDVDRLNQPSKRVVTNVTSGQVVTIVFKSLFLFCVGVLVLEVLLNLFGLLGENYFMSGYWIYSVLLMYLLVPLGFFWLLCEIVFSSPKKSPTDLSKQLTEEVHLQLLMVNKAIRLMQFILAIVLVLGLLRPYISGLFFHLGLSQRVHLVEITISITLFLVFIAAAINLIVLVLRRRKLRFS